MQKDQVVAIGPAYLAFEKIGASDFYATAEGKMYSTLEEWNTS